MIGIYKITSPTKRVYIGQSLSIEDRVQKYRTLQCKNQPKLYNSIKKYGWDRHVFTVLVLCDPSQLNELEKYFVGVYNSFDSNHGLNLRDGGGSKGRLSDSTKAKLREHYRRPDVLEKCREHAKNTLARHIKENGVWNKDVGRKYIPRINGNKGSNNRAAKLTETDVLRIRAEYSKEIGNSLSLSKKYNISQSIVTRIVARTIWKYI